MRHFLCLTGKGLTREHLVRRVATDLKEEVWLFKLRYPGTLRSHLNSSLYQKYDLHCNNGMDAILEVKEKHPMPYKFISKDMYFLGFKVLVPKLNFGKTPGYNTHSYTQPYPHKQRFLSFEPMSAGHKVAYLPLCQGLPSNEIGAIRGASPSPR